VGKIVDVAKAIYKWIMGTAVPAITGFAGAVKDAVSTAIDWFGQVFGAVTTALAPIASWINDNFISTFNAVAEFVAAWAARVGEMFSNMAKLVEMGFMTVLSSFIGSTLQMIVKSFQALMNFLRPLWSLFWASLKAVVSIVFGGIRAIIEQVLGIIRGIFQVFTGLLRGDWSKVWEGLKTIVSSAWEPIRKFLSGALDTLVGYFKGLPGRLKDLGKGLFDFIKEAFKSAINWVIRGWNNLDFDLNIPSNPVTDFFGIGGKGFTIGTPDIPELARGGIISRPTLALVGERGPEAVIPLNPGRGVGGRSEFHITVYAQDGRDFGRQFLDYVKSNGGREVKQALGISA
jgi:phage-related minor tail protein